MIFFFFLNFLFPSTISTNAGQVPSDTGKPSQIHKLSFEPREPGKGQFSPPTPSEDLVDEKTRKLKRQEEADTDPAFLQPVWPAQATRQKIFIFIFLSLGNW